MKILNAQTEFLTNYEVYEHLTKKNLGQRKRGQRRGPGNLETLAKELLQYLRTPPNPLSQEPITYSPESIHQLLQRLRPYNLAKGEVFMILNLRPCSAPALSTIIEDMGERFDETQRQEIVDIIADVLGSYPQDGEQEKGREDQANKAA